jgi:[histone H3]-trimethyl-L-lysine4 demethylase
MSTAAPMAPSAPPPFPYSARRAPPLDLRTVERKGPSAVRNPLTRSRPHDLREAPTYHPTEEEFRDPMTYIQSIHAEASKFGICKIVPPDSWNPDFAIDTERFHFRTRRQTINETDGGNRTNLHYLDQLSKFHRQYGTQLNRFPSVDKRPLDLYKLKKAVEIRGGFEKVCRDKKWAEIGRDLGYSGKIMSSLSTSLKNSYQRWLHPYESWLAAAKANGGIAPDFEYNQAAFSPSVSQHASPAHQPPPMMPGGPVESPAMQASMALNATVNTPHAANPPHPPEFAPQVLPPAPAPQTEPQPAPRPASSGFMAVNSGGFQAVNQQPSGFMAVNHQPPAPAIKSEGFPPIAAAPMYAGGFASVNGVAPRPPMEGHLMPNGTTNSLKRTISHESMNGDPIANEMDADGLHPAKRPKKDGPAIPSNHMPAMRPATPQVKGKSGPRRLGDKCEKCGKSDDPANIILCENCELGYHRYCAEPPLQTMPDFDWNCSKCLIGTNDYGFEEGSVYSLKVFQEKANNFKEHYFASKRTNYDVVTGTTKRPTEDDVEREFWRLVEDITESVEVEYGADIHSTTHGSGFPTIEKNPLNPYSRDQWNLNVMPFLEESLFRHIKGDISGMTVPWLYVGMCFSTFCWHNEDHYAYSANYQHFGSTKTWYGIPGKDAQKFEEAMRKAVPELFESQPDLLFQLVTILPPDQLRRAGVDVYVLDQRAGEFVITFPQAYHAGFNHGFNFNEAVNFAPADWEPFGDTSVQRLRDFHKQPCFSHDELLITAAGADTSIKTSKWLAPALVRSRDRELSERSNFVTKHKELHPHEDCTYDTLAPQPAPDCGLSIVVEDKELQEEDYQCYHCKAYTYFSQFRCHQSGRVSCLLHPDIMECCSEPPEQRLRSPNHSLCVRYTNDELETLVQKVVDKANVPEAWHAKLDALLEDESAPALRSMHTLLSEGTKIPYHLPGLEDLSDFVKKCDLWVEEANLYLMRKQQNRRKNDKVWRKKSVGGKDAEKDDQQLTLERMKELLEDGKQLSFSAPQLTDLQDKLDTMNEWRRKVKPLCAGREHTSLEDLTALLEEGRGFMAAMPELTGLEKRHACQQWFAQVEAIRNDMGNQTLDECKAILEKVTELDIDPQSIEVQGLKDVVRQGYVFSTSFRITLTYAVNSGSRRRKKLCQQKTCTILSLSHCIHRSRPTYSLSTRTLLLRWTRFSQRTEKPNAKSSRLLKRVMIRISESDRHTFTSETSSRL